MLIYSYKLDKYIRNKIFPRILLLPDRYVVKGSFRRKIPYVTDIDLVSTVYPDINKDNLYPKLVELIKSLKDEPDIMLIYVTCGTDNRFKLVTASDEEVQRIKPLLTKQENEVVDTIVKKYSNNQVKRLFYLKEFVRRLYKLRWTVQNVLDNRMVLRDGTEITMTEMIQNNVSLLLKYFVQIGSYPIGIDNVIIYEQVDLMETYQKAAQYQLKLACYAREYYYMLFPFRHYFRHDKTISRELSLLIEKKFGLYKQLMVRIDTYENLYTSGNLKYDMAKKIVISILNDIKKLPKFQSNVSEKIKEAAQEGTPEEKMEKWNILLCVLYDEINQSVNLRAEKYFRHYYELIPDDLKDRYYLE